MLIIIKARPTAFPVLLFCFLFCFLFFFVLHLKRVRFLLVHFVLTLS